MYEREAGQGQQKMIIKRSTNLLFMYYVALSTTCEPVNCFEPEVPPYGKITAKHFSFGSIANYSCMDGYMLVGNPSVKCDADSTWKGEIPVCLPVDCGGLEVTASFLTCLGGDMVVLKYF